MLLNLIGNAIKFTDAGGVLVIVARARTDTTDRICFTVADTGPGLREDDMERIFEEFEQSDGTSTRTHGGAGLGLAISRRLVTAMGGTISVSSRLGEGSEFVFEIPAIGATEAPQNRQNILVGPARGDRVEERRRGRRHRPHHPRPWRRRRRGRDRCPGDALRRAAATCC